MDVCTKQEPLDINTTEIVTIKEEQELDYEAMLISEEGNEEYKFTEEFKIIVEEECKEGEQDPLSTNREYSNTGDHLELRSPCAENDSDLNCNKPYDGYKQDISAEPEIQRNSLRSIRIHKGPTRLNSLIENCIEETQVKNEPQKESNQNSEKSGGDNSEDKVDESSTRETSNEDASCAYFKMWKTIYSELEFQEIINIYREKNGNIRKAMEEMRLLNEKQRRKGLEENTVVKLNQVKIEPEDEANQNSVKRGIENSEDNGEEANQHTRYRKFIDNYYNQSKGDTNGNEGVDSPLQDPKIDKYFKMWKVLYQELDDQEFDNIYEKNKGSVRKAMDEMRLQNEERRRKREAGYTRYANKKRKITFEKGKQNRIDVSELSSNPFIPEWKLLYPLVDEEEQIHIHLKNNLENELTMLELQQLNDERRKRRSPEQEKQKDGLSDEEGVKDLGDIDPSKKPDYNTMVSLIDMVISDSPKQQLRLAEIFQGFETKFPCYTQQNIEKQKWKRYISVILRMYDRFKKVPPKGRDSCRKGNYWALGPGHKGNFKCRDRRNKDNFNCRDRRNKDTPGKGQSIGAILPQIPIEEDFIISVPDPLSANSEYSNSEDDDTEEGVKDSDDSDPSKKPGYSIFELIEIVISESPEKQLRLSEIFQCVETKFPYYAQQNAENKQRWKNNISYTLSIYNYFKNVPSTAVTRKGNYWALSKARATTRQDKGKNKYWVLDSGHKYNFQHRDRQETDTLGKRQSIGAILPQEQRNIEFEAGESFKQNMTYNEDQQNISVERIAIQPLCLRGIRIEKSPLKHKIPIEEDFIKSVPDPLSTNSEYSNSEDDDTEEGFKDSSDSDPSKKPGYTMIEILVMVIRDSPEQQLRLSDIFQCVETKYPYYAQQNAKEKQKWKKRMGQILSAYGGFKKVLPKVVTAKDCDRSGKGNCWALDPGHKDNFKRRDRPEMNKLGKGQSIGAILPQIAIEEDLIKSEPDPLPTNSEYSDSEDDDTEQRNIEFGAGESFKQSMSYNEDQQNISVERITIQPLCLRGIRIEKSPIKHKIPTEEDFIKSEPDPLSTNSEYSNSEDDVTEEGDKDSGDRNPSEKPGFTTIALVEMIIRDSPEQQLRLSEIVQRVETKFPYYAQQNAKEKQKWKNCISQTLSLYEHFKKVPPKVVTAEDCNRSGKLGHCWALVPRHKDNFQHWDRRNKDLPGKGQSIGAILPQDQRNIEFEVGASSKLSVSYNEDQQNISVERIAIQPLCLRGIRIENKQKIDGRHQSNKRSRSCDYGFLSSKPVFSRDDDPLQEMNEQGVEEIDKNHETIINENNNATDNDSPFKESRIDKYVKTWKVLYPKFQLLGVEETNKNSETIINDSPFEEARIDKYLKMWKVLYPMVAVQEQRKLYQENKDNVRQAMDKMKQLNEERTIKHCPVCNKNKKRKGRHCKKNCKWLVSDVKPKTPITKAKTFRQFIEEWKLIYTLVDVKEQVHLYVENNSNIEQTLSKLQLLNEERKKRITIELDNKIKDLTDSSGKESPKKTKVVPSKAALKEKTASTSKFKNALIIKTSKRGQPMALYKGFRLMVAKKYAAFTWYRCCIRRCKARIKISNKTPYRLLAISKKTHNHLPEHKCPTTEIAVQTA